MIHNQYIKAIVCFVFFMLFFCFISDSFAVNQKVVAIVDDHVITDSDVEKKLNLIVKMGNISVNQELLSDLRKQVLSDIIDSIIIRQEAARLFISVSDQELDSIFANFIAYNKIALDGFLDFFKQNKLDINVFKENLRTQKLWSQVINNKFSSKFTLSDDEVKGVNLLYDKMKSETLYHDDIRLQLAEIAIYFDSDQDAKKRSIRLMTEIARQPDVSKNFNSLVKSFSQGTTSQNNGLLGWVRFGDLSNEVKVAVKDLKEGDVTMPIYNDERVMILKILKKSVPESLKKKVDEKQREEELRSALIQRKVFIYEHNYIKKLKNDALIEVK